MITFLPSLSVSNTLEKQPVIEKASHENPTTSTAYGY